MQSNSNISRNTFLAGTFPGPRSKNEKRPKLDWRAATVRKRCARQLQGLTFDGTSKNHFWPDLLFITLWAKSTRHAHFGRSAGQNGRSAARASANDAQVNFAG